MNQRAHLIALLNLEAVVPVLRDLGEISEEWRKSLQGLDLRLKIAFATEPWQEFVIRDGTIWDAENASSPNILALWFPTANQINRAFDNNPFAIALPWGNVGGLRQIPKITALLKDLETWLRPNEENLRKSGHLDAFTTITFRLLTRGAAILANNEDASRHLTQHGPYGLVLFSIAGNTHSSWVWLKPDETTSGRGTPPKTPDAEITFANTTVARTALLKKLDHQAAVGAGKIQIRGHATLGDLAGLVMERIDLYLKP